MGDEVDDSTNSSSRLLLVLFLLMGASSLVASHVFGEAGEATLQRRHSKGY
ncbi:hypothetical protein CRG98_000924 [Punica granatum]|uniref:Uncharacterized protein n=1 Tax=Punica granatum TaxID=22663 RepID=A0A2I0LDE8_PUNGR|nr:hypothetical protein CRG98_000924 [Punica granatum]